MQSACTECGWQPYTWLTLHLCGCDIQLPPVHAGEMKPTLFIGVPRVFDRIYAGVLAKVKAGGAVKKWLFDYAYKHKLYYLNQGYPHDKVCLMLVGGPLQLYVPLLVYDSHSHDKMCLMLTGIQP